MDRPLTDRELAVLDWMLRGVPDEASFRAQVPTLRVRGSCSCGCPTIDFVPPGSQLGSPLSREGWVRGSAIGVTLFADQSQLTSLEVTVYAGDELLAFPDPADLLDSQEM